MKRCPDCGVEKPLDEFGPDRTRRDGRAGYCRPCKRAQARVDNAKRRDAIRAWERDHSTPCVDCGKLTSGGYRTANAKQPATVRCADCEQARKHAEARERVARWLRMRASGMNNRVIAKAEGVTDQAVADALQRSSVARFPGLEWQPSPHFRVQI